jgi:hypothetical protein
MVVVLGVTAKAAYSEFKFRERGAALDADIATYKRQQWDRPVLRGQAGEGNAALEALHALQGMSPLNEVERDRLATQLHHGAPLLPDQLALAAKHAAMIGKLRDATQLSWAMTELSPERGDAVAAPPYPLMMDAALLMLASASSANPDDCLTICADVVRLGQDLVPGAPLEAISVAMRLTSVSAPVIARCSEHATIDGLARAARELGTMAAHPPPIGSGIEFADLQTSARLRKLAELLPDNADDSPFERLRQRPMLIEASAFFEKPSRWRELNATTYPLPLDTWRREQEWRQSSPLPLVADSAAGVDGWLYDDMRGQALLRALTVELGTVAARLRVKRLPRVPVGLSDPGLRDPFSGQELKWRVPDNGAELAVWSVGEDRRDDKGMSEWTAMTPIDAVVHFQLPPLPGAPAAKPQR